MNNKNYTYTEEQEALFQWLNHKRWTHFITLTFKSTADGGFVSDAYAEKALVNFYKRLNKALFGGRSKKRVFSFAIKEYSKAGNIHFHLMLMSPVKHIETESIIKKCWYGSANFCGLGFTKNGRVKGNSTPSTRLEILIQELCGSFLIEDDITPKVATEGYWLIKLTGVKMRENLTRYIFKTCSKYSSQLFTQYLELIAEV